MENLEVENIVIGKFKPKRAFLNFVSAVSGARVRIISNSAYIKGEKLSGMLDGTKLKFLLRDNGTIDVEEINTSLTDHNMISRFIDEIDSYDITGYANKFIISGLEFHSESGERCYLEVDNTKPIDKLKDLVKVEVSDKVSNFLDELFKDENIEGEGEAELEVKEVTENVVVKETKTNEKEVSKTSSLEDSFKKMNDDKVNELKSRIDSCEDNIQKFKRDMKQSEKNIDTENKSLSVLQTRLDSFNIKEESLGYVFHVSDEKQSEQNFSESETALISKICEAINADKNILTKLISNKKYIINIAKKDNFDDKTLTKEAYERVSKIDLEAIFRTNSDKDIEYIGKLGWHELVDKLIKKGFEQNPDFDKNVGSNSYESDEDKSENDDLMGYENASMVIFNELTSQEAPLQEPKFKLGDQVVFVGTETLETLVKDKVYNFYRNIGEGAEITLEDIDNTKFPTESIVIKYIKDIISLKEWESRKSTIDTKQNKKGILEILKNKFTFLLKWLKNDK